MYNPVSNCEKLIGKQPCYEPTSRSLSPQNNDKFCCKIKSKHGCKLRLAEVDQCGGTTLLLQHLSLLEETEVSPQCDQMLVRQRKHTRKRLGEGRKRQKLQ